MKNFASFPRNDVKKNPHPNPTNQQKPSAQTRPNGSTNALAYKNEPTESPLLLPLIEPSNWPCLVELRATQD
jgi:hypothetical protein